MKLTGTIEDPSGAYKRVDAEGATYQQARQTLSDTVPEDQRLIAIRTS